MALRDGNLLTSDFGNGKGYQLAGFSTSLDGSFTRPSITGVSIDNTYTYSCADDAFDKAYQHVGFGSTVNNSFSIGSGGLGCTTDDTDFYAYNNSKAKQYLGFSSTVQASFADAGWFSISYDDVGLYLGNTSGKIIRYNGLGSSVRGSFTDAGKSHTGVTWDGTNVYSSEDGANKHWQHSGFTQGAAASQNSQGGNPYGIEWDDTDARMGVSVTYRRRVIISGFTKLKVILISAAVLSSLGLGYFLGTLKEQPMEVPCEYIVWHNGLKHCISAEVAEHIDKLEKGFTNRLKSQRGVIEVK